MHAAPARDCEISVKAWLKKKDCTNCSFIPRFDWSTKGGQKWTVVCKAKALNQSEKFALKDVRVVFAGRGQAVCEIDTSGGKNDTCEADVKAEKIRLGAICVVKNAWIDGEFCKVTGAEVERSDLVQLIHLPEKTKTFEVDKGTEVDCLGNDEWMGESGPISYQVTSYSSNGIVLESIEGGGKIPV